METGIAKEAREEGIPCSDENQKLLVAFVNLYDEVMPTATAGWCHFDI